MTIDLDEIERLAKFATPGPWTVNDDERIDVADDGTVRAEWVAGFDVVSAVGDVVGPEGLLEGQRDDANFIAACDPTTVLAMVARIRELEAQLAEVDALVRRQFRHSDEVRQPATFHEDTPLIDSIITRHRARTGDK